MIHQVLRRKFKNFSLQNDNSDKIYPKRPFPVKFIEKYPFKPNLPIFLGCLFAEEWELSSPLRKSVISPKWLKLL